MPFRRATGVGRTVEFSFDEVTADLNRRVVRAGEMAFDGRWSLSGKV